MRPIWHGAIWFAIGLLGWLISSVYAAFAQLGGNAGGWVYLVYGFFGLMLAAFPVALSAGYLLKRSASRAAGGSRAAVGPAETTPASRFPEVGRYPRAVWVRCTVCGKPVEWPSARCPRCGDPLRPYR